MSSTDLLLDVATAARLFHASDGTGFADLFIEGHRETWPLRSKRFQAWLRQQYYERTWDAPSPAALNAALNVLEAQAQFDGPQRKVSVRVAEQDGLIYLDLADEFWRCIEIDANGWRIAEDPPVRFRRSAGMQPLPLPLRGGSIDSLAPFLNLASENDFVLIVAWLLGALRAGGPYPVLAIAGEQGSAKTVLSKLLRAVIDPNVAPVRALPRDERELFIAASNGHVLAFDNLSGLPPWLSDTLCRLDERRCLFDTSAVHRSGRNSVCGRPTGHSQRNRGYHHPPRSCRPRYPADARTDCRTSTPAGACALAGVRARTTAHPWRAPRCGRAWVTHAAACPPQAVAAHG